MSNSKAIHASYTFVLIFFLVLSLVSPTIVSASDPQAPNKNNSPVKQSNPPSPVNFKDSAYVNLPLTLPQKLLGRVNLSQDEFLPTTLSVSIVNSPWAPLDSNNPSGSGGESVPQVFLVEAKVTNTGPNPAHEVKIKLDDKFNADAFWFLLPGENEERSADVIQPGGSYYAYWFTRYSSIPDSSHEYTVSARCADVSNCDLVSTSTTVQTKSYISTGNSGIIQTSATVVVGVAFTMTLTYDLGSNPKTAMFSPVGNIDFNPDAYRLLSSQVRLFNDAHTQSQTYDNQIYFSSLPAFAENAEVKFVFIALQPTDTNLCSYTAIDYHSQSKYDQFYCDPVRGTLVNISGTLKTEMLKRGSHTLAQQGDTVAYTINYTNTGTLPLSYAWVWDDVNTSVASILPLSINPPSDPLESTTSRVAWYIGGVPPAGQPNSSGALHFSVLVDGNGTDLPDQTLLVNHAYFGINPGSLPPVSAMTSVFTTTIQAPTISIQKSDGVASVKPGEHVTYTLQVANTGSVKATNVVITDTLPAYVTSVVDGQPLVWNVPEILPGGTYQVQLPVKVDWKAPNGTQLTNTMQTRYANPSGHIYTVKTATDQDTVTAPVLSISKLDTPDPVLTGRDLTYTLNYANNGPSEATNVVITDVVPVNTTYVPLSCTGGCTYDDVTKVVGWEFPSIGANTSGQVSFTVVVDEDLNTGATLTNNDYGILADQADFIKGAPVVTTVTRLAAFFEGHAFIDSNGNGIMDGTETGRLPGVPITLTQAVVPTMDTDSNGYYRFRIETQGPIEIQAGLPAGYFRTTPGLVVYAQATLGITTTLNFGYAPISSDFGIVYGTVFEDTNHNQDWELGEYGLPGATISSTEAVNSPVTTNAFGQYTLRFNTSGNATITETNPPGYVSTTPDSIQTLVVTGSEDSSPVNFGDFHGIKVSGLVFEDTDVNAEKGSGEKGLPNVTIAFDGESTTTDTDGIFTFYHLPADSNPLLVTETDPLGYVSTNAIPGNGMSRIDANTLQIDSPQAGTEYKNALFGDVKRADAVSIQGQVWNDNGAGGGGLANGLKDPSEPGLAGATISLSSGMSQVTGADGTFELYGPTGIPITVMETNPDGYVSTNALPGNNAVKVDNDTLTVSGLAGGETSAGNLFGDVQTSSVAVISGYVFHDANENGILDQGESGLPDVQVTMGITTGVSISVYTDPHGKYQFAVVPGTNIRIDSSSPGPNYHPTTPETAFVRPPAAAEYENNNFGYTDNQGVIVFNGIVFEDANSNGLQDFGELGINGVTITLDNVDSLPDKTYTTQAHGLIAGTFVFTSPVEGYYGIIEENPSGYRSTTPDRLNLQTELGQSYFVDFGDVKTGPGTIYGIVFDDANGNGIQDLGEPGLPGVVISVTVGGGSQWITETTKAYGQYTYGFEIVEQGYHTVQEQDPAKPNYRSTTPDKVTLNILFNHSYIVNFGDTDVSTFSSIMGIVFNDKNWDGNQDPSEDGLSDVLITLSDGKTTHTGQFGTYSVPITETGFTNVHETDPDGYHSTTPNDVWVNVGSLGQKYQVDFGDNDSKLITSIFGTVFDDLNGNGIYDSEFGIQDVPVELSGPLVPADPALTNQWGQYTFLVEKTGVYIVKETDPAGYFSTTPNEVHVGAALGNGYQVDFGDAKDDSGFAAIFGTVFEDADKDGKYESGETGLSNVKITLDGTQNRPTNQYGGYTFTTKVTGAHLVEETDPVNYASTTPNQVTLSDVALGHGYPVDYGDFFSCTCSPDWYEQDDTYTTAKEIKLGLANKQTHDFCDDNVDWLVFNANASSTYTITTSSWGVRADTYLALFGTDGQTLLAANDDYQTSTDFSSRIVWKALVSGNYYIRVSNQAGQSCCLTDYDITVEEKFGTFLYLPLVVKSGGGSAPARPADASPLGVITHMCPDDYEYLEDQLVTDDTWMQALLKGPIQSGDIQIHSFDSNPALWAVDKDFNWFWLKTNQVVTFTVTPVSGTLTFMELFDGQGRALGVTGSTSLPYKATTPGRYFLSVGPQTGNTFGCADVAGYQLEALFSLAYDLYLPIVLK